MFNIPRIIDIADTTLEVFITEDTDIDSRFKAVDIEDGTVYMINGWLIDSIQELIV